MSWHLEKSPGYDHDGTWMVFAGSELAGSVRPTWRGQSWSSRPRRQGYASSMRVGPVCKTRKDAAVHVLDTWERRQAHR